MKNCNKSIYYDEYEDLIVIDEELFSKPTILRDDFLQIRTTGHDYDFVASIYNKTNKPIHLIFDEECTILYIGPDDINQDGYGLGSMIVAEFQYIESMKAKGFLPADY